MTDSPHGPQSMGQVTTASGVAVDALTDAGTGRGDVDGPGGRPGRALVWPACGLGTLPTPRPSGDPDTGSDPAADGPGAGDRPPFTGTVPPRPRLSWGQWWRRWWIGPPHEQPDPIPGWLAGLYLASQGQQQGGQHQDQHQGQQGGGSR